MLARHEGRVVLIWGAIPGERVRARIERLFFFNDTATTKNYTRKDTLSLHDALPIYIDRGKKGGISISCSVTPYHLYFLCQYRSEEHTSELQSPFLISYAVFCLNKKSKQRNATVNSLSRMSTPPRLMRHYI